MEMKVSKDEIGTMSYATRDSHGGPCSRVVVSNTRCCPVSCTHNTRPGCSPSSASSHGSADSSDAPPPAPAPCHHTPLATTRLRLASNFVEAAS